MCTVIHIWAGMGGHPIVTTPPCPRPPPPTCHVPCPCPSCRPYPLCGPACIMPRVQMMCAHALVRAGRVCSHFVLVLLLSLHCIVTLPCTHHGRAAGSTTATLTPPSLAIPIPNPSPNHCPAGAVMALVSVAMGRRWFGPFPYPCSLLG